MLEEIEKDLFIANGPEVSFFTFPYPTRMVVVRLPNGDVWIWSPIELTENLATAVNAVGPVRHIVSPNKIHHLFMGAWAERYPDAKMYAPPGLAPRRKDLNFSAELTDKPEEAWSDVIDQVVFSGSLCMQEVAFFHRPTKTVIIGDLVQRHERTSGIKGSIMRLDSLVGENGSTPREWRASFVRRKQTRAARERALEWNAERMIIAHGSNADENASAILSRALSWM